MLNQFYTPEAVKSIEEYLKNNCTPFGLDAVLCIFHEYSLVNIYNKFIEPLTPEVLEEVSKEEDDHAWDDLEEEMLQDVLNLKTYYKVFRRDDFETTFLILDLDSKEKQVVDNIEFSDFLI